MVPRSANWERVPDALDFLGGRERRTLPHKQALVAMKANAISACIHSTSKWLPSCKELCFRIGETSPGALHPVLGTSLEEGCSQTGSGFKNNEGGQRVGGQGHLLCSA